ncbi:MAG: glycosyltransferase [Chloroflexi bacterium]|nr:glycosyltransferase [Chloroflexota bacterium]
MRVSIVIPAYNEARRLPATLTGWNSFLAAQAFDSEVIVADDGSRDRTAEVAQRDGARVVRLALNQGKGAAVRAGVLSASGDVIAYVDADMNIAPPHLLHALDLLRAGADLVVGRRDLSEYAAAEGPIRLLAGGLVQVSRRLLVLSSIADTQCGFKVFGRELAQTIFSQTRINSFAFDIEVLFIATRRHARIVEMPVTTTYRGESTFHVRRHLAPFLRDIAQIRLNAIAGRYES